jgi:hypothetical protein
MIDEMIDETFPASDPPQLRAGSRAATPTASDAPAPDPKDPAARGTPATIGNQGAIPASGILEESVPLTDQGVVTLRFDGGRRHLHIYLGAEGLSLDARTLDRLIAVLSQKRAAME